MSIPKSVRDELGKRSVLYIAPGSDGSLGLYTETSFAELADQFAARSPTQQDVRDFSRLFYSQAQRVELDKQGRIRIPTELAELGSLAGEVVLLGVRDHLELWNQTTWENYWGAKQVRFDEIGERAMVPNTESETVGQPNQPR